MTDMMVKEICEGVEGTGVKCGVIGEVGVSWPMTDFEKKSLKASALAQQQTGDCDIIVYIYVVDMYIHVHRSMCRFAYIHVQQVSVKLTINGPFPFRSRSAHSIPV